MIRQEELPEAFFDRYVDAIGRVLEARTYRTVFKTLPCDVVKRICNTVGIPHNADSMVSLLKLLPIRLAQNVVQFCSDKHNFLSEQGDTVLETGSVVVAKRGPLELHSVILYPTVFFSLPDGASDYTRTLAHRLDDNKFVRHDDVVKELYRAPAEKRVPVDLPVSTWCPVGIDSNGKFLTENVDILPFVKDKLTEDQMSDSRKFEAAAQEVLATGFYEKAMESMRPA